MNGQEILGNVAFYVSIAVVIGMAIMFSILFAIYGYYKIKVSVKNMPFFRFEHKFIIISSSRGGMKTYGKY